MRHFAIAPRTEVQQVNNYPAYSPQMSNGTLFPYQVTRTHPDGSTSQGYELQLLLDPLFPAPLAPKLIAAAHGFDDYLHRVVDALLQYHDRTMFRLSREPLEPNPGLSMVQQVLAVAGSDIPPETREMLKSGCGTFTRLDDIRFHRLRRLMENTGRLAELSESI